MTLLLPNFLVFGPKSHLSSCSLPPPAIIIWTCVVFSLQVDPLSSALNYNQNVHWEDILYTPVGVLTGPKRKLALRTQLGKTVQGCGGDQFLILWTKKTFHNLHKSNTGEWGSVQGEGEGPCKVSSEPFLGSPLGEMGWVLMEMPVSVQYLSPHILHADATVITLTSTPTLIHTLGL